MPNLVLFVLSDSSGETASHVVQAAIAQFESGELQVHRLPRVRSSADVIRYIEDVQALETSRGCAVLVAYTLVLPEYRATLERLLLETGIDAIDLINPLISKLAELSNLHPFSQPGRSHVLDDAYFRRMEAVNFSVHFDDGRSPEGIHQADVVLTGLSRTSKTPNCMYLAQHYGLKAANVPLVPGVNPPDTLFQVAPCRIIGLTIDPDYLFSLRRTRAHALGLSTSSSYADPEMIIEEVRFARRVFQELGCHVIDVSARAIEETSSEIFIYLKHSNEGLR